MKRFLLLFMVSLLLVILQQSIFSGISIFGVTFDIVFVYIVCYSIVRDEVESVVVALVTGILRDAFFPAVFGMNTVLYILVAYSIGFLQKRIYKDSIVIPMFFTFAATCIKGIVYFCYFYIVSYKFNFSYHMTGVVLLESLFNSLISIIIFRMVKRMDSINVLKQEWKF